ncbi:melanopsin-A-like isoform X2 [Dunckerocampus dactyliophorus]|uniref:melanopsin-A-like isoform X2 n=1 Tax=Dunckerocampus dactyliophorus TaxID=161453 RepID=UPI0024060720|nr:melanopsin-A-like isoform X2 [Dunckerocampus dactyliophorus]
MAPSPPAAAHQHQPSHIWTPELRAHYEGAPGERLVELNHSVPPPLHCPPLTFMHWEMDSRLLIGPEMHTPDPVAGAPWNMSSISPHRLMDLVPIATAGSVAPSHPFPTVDVPDHAHYTIGVVILAVGITGILGNFLVIYAFCRSQSLRTPSNIFIINLAITDFFMCLTQTPTFFITSMHKRWVFGKKGCELYAFCGALFGICSMMTLMVIAVDRYVVITKPLASLGAMSRRKALSIMAATWLYSMGWSLPPFFGWIIIFCYCCIFRAIRHTTQAFEKIHCGGTRNSVKRFHRMKSEWKMAKIALIVILLFVVSWAPYSCVALTAFAGYADLLTPYMNSVPAVIAKASAIHNPIIYAITHPKYRSAISRYVPYLGVLLCIRGRDRFNSSSSFQSTRRSTLTSQSESRRHCRPARSSQSDSESAHFADMDEDTSFQTPVNHQLSSDVKDGRHSSQRLKIAKEPEDISMSDLSILPQNPNHLPASLGRTANEPGLCTVCKTSPAVIVTSISSPSILHSPPGFQGNLKLTKTYSPVAKESLDRGRLKTTMTA